MQKNTEVDIQAMCIGEGLRKRYALEKLGIQTLIDIVEKLGESQLMVTTSDSILEVILGNLLKKLPEETRTRLQNITTIEEAQEAYFNKDAEPFEEHAAFTLWVGLITTPDEARCACKIAAEKTIQEVLAVRILGSFYEK